MTTRETLFHKKLFPLTTHEYGEMKKAIAVLREAK
jgi:hypothetical protein